ncbi:hypothetical protein [Mesorhizobium sp. M2A.F.Ca.ET.046.03.2.1]|nr:hypothetical protein [Mesorhizobium sp. M2A.F.Ca.ET.046.03.2.1]
MAAVFFLLDDAVRDSTGALRDSVDGFGEVSSFDRGPAIGRSDDMTP